MIPLLTGARASGRMACLVIALFVALGAHFAQGQTGDENGDSLLTLHSGASAEPEPNASGPENSAGVPLFAFPAGEPEALPDHLLVVYNSNDPDSAALADYYAQRRHIPQERVLGIACSTAEEITRAQYEATVREPIISYIYQKNWMTRRTVPVRIGGRTLDLLIATQNNIWAMVLMRGVPLENRAG